MARDIEEFLKMAAQRRQQQKQNAGGQPVPPQQPQPAKAPPSQQPPAQRHGAQQRPPVLQRPVGNQQTARPQKQSSQPVRQLTKQSVSEHVQQHINTRDITAHAERLGETVGLADEKLEGHLHDVFDHSVATLKSEQSAAPGTSASSSRNQSAIAAELHSMLRSPTSVRHAIVLAEILKRPDFD